MKSRWLLASVIVPAIVLSVTACSSQPEPTPPTDTVPTSSIATVVPIPTLLPTATAAAQFEPTAIASATASVAPTAQRTAAPRQQAAFPAPSKIEPTDAALFKNGNDIQFVYSSVGKLEPNQCYLLHIELAVPNLPKGNRGDDFVDTEHCGDAGPAGKELKYVLYRGKFTNSPNYGTMLTQINDLAPEVRELRMTWTVRVVQNNGRAADGVHYNTVALSPESPVSGFTFQP